MKLVKNDVANINNIFTFGMQEIKQLKLIRIQPPKDLIKSKIHWIDWKLYNILHVIDDLKLNCGLH